VEKSAYQAYQKEYRDKNKEALTAKSKAWNKLHYLANREAYKKRNALWRENNQERYKALSKKYREANKEKMTAKSKAWYAANTERAKATQRTKKLRNYGLTQEQFQVMQAAQNSTCPICAQPFTKQPAIDHDHATGAVRGLLCRQCNAGIGSLRDSPANLQRAIEYLNKSSSGATLTTSSEL
jgi:Recombination endonuclease VII